ncbi:hypothetical protein DYB37_007596 [Aphanomyces astaci]|uniref:Uncharacterized protein n=1 Tax=Aphanomyces astaci TaxID=112090 RepID=A0A418DBL4_APHAT|nr:hypothetical protein DYB35_006309 [Aphanomyces astaci]RHZ28511.1 hypothetical protein DYB37_007596 [Aphanomyces astaci]
MRSIPRIISSVLVALVYVHAVSVTVFRNGESTGGVPLDVLPEHVTSGQTLAAYLSTFVNVEGIIVDAEDSAKKIIADRVVTGKGVHVHAYDDIQDHDNLYLIPPDFHFVWPYVEFGHRVAIESTQSPTGKPIVLESFSESPRVFLLHDFFTSDQADELIERTLSITTAEQKLKRSRVLTKE